jgi:hypothetical protein
VIHNRYKSKHLKSIELAKRSTKEEQKNHYRIKSKIKPKWLKFLMKTHKAHLVKQEKNQRPYPIVEKKKSSPND